MRINNPVIRAGSVVPASITLPFLRYDQPSTVTILPGSWNDQFVMALSDQPAFGPLFRGTYLIETQLVLLGGAADGTVKLRTSFVSGVITEYQLYELVTVPANTTVYHHTFMTLHQPVAQIWSIGLDTQTASTDIKIQGETGAPDDWTWRIITKQASNAT